MTFDRGRPTLSATSPIQTLASLDPSEVPAPSPDYARNYDQFGGAASWHNINMTPDFPSAAQAALANYEAGQGERLDGVIAADPFALRSMLGVTGAVTVPGIDRSLDARNVVAFTTNGAYSAFPEADRRKVVLGAVATGVLQRFLDLDGRALPRLRALGEAASGGHLLVFSTDPSFEHGLELTGASGRFSSAPGSDIASITVNNASASKIDYYAVRHVAFHVQLDADMGAATELTAKIENEAPSAGLPRYVIGPFVEGADPGDQIPLITGWCHHPCTLERAQRDGEDVGVTPGSELGVDWFRDYRTIAAGTTGSFSITTRTSGVWSGNSSSGTYRLVVDGQTTIRPTVWDLSVTVPSGMRIVWTSRPMEIDGATATWSGVPESAMTVEIHFRAPLPLRMVRDVTRPVFGA